MPERKPKLTHVDEQGAAMMVDVGDKKPTKRSAQAEGWIKMQPVTLDAIRENAVAKGDVLTVAKIAGVAAAKRTSEWIPLAHPLQIDVVDINLILDQDLPGVRVQAHVGLTGRTGAELEALVGTSAALLTVYDMCKAIDRGMEIAAIRLVEKRGGRSGTWRRADT